MFFNVSREKSGRPGRSGDVIGRGPMPILRCHRDQRYNFLQLSTESLTCLSHLPVNDSVDSCKSTADRNGIPDGSTR